MTTVTDDAGQHRTARSRSYRMTRLAGSSLVYCAALAPLAVFALVTAPLGRSDRAARRWRALRTGLLGAPPVAGAGRRPGPVAVVGHGLLSLLLGLAALVPLGVELLMVLRGVLYGVVDPGPYTNSWGGPTRAGAWLAHFLVGLPLAAAGLAALVGIAAVHQRLTGGLDGARPAPWLIPVTLLIAVAGALLFVAWTHQI
ncbi:hypothetical protein [Micromonospora inositola]|uniref:Uncharacterized protein n=1 Tax=Micromonospora inositola TaxID=47865 RepID=A0A1C5I5J4_9ACTN|nr:hypothetical protein [Micromonospora inositola]SCG53241.1 hypothetical protein GA0070613_2254 [Micromonospora inositola]